VLSLGEATWSERLGARHVARLARVRDLLARRGLDTRDTVLACYGGGGFDDAVLRDDGVLTVGPRTSAHRPETAARRRPARADFTWSAA
jgi:hypothetical protein